MPPAPQPSRLRTAAEIMPMVAFICCLVNMIDCQFSHRELSNLQLGWIIALGVNHLLFAAPKR